MRNKRMLSALMAAALMAALALPAGAAGSSFSDVTDPATAVNADILHLMGVVNGVGGSRFNPGGNLTRAEFCTMVVKFMQEGDKVPLYATRTIFADVTAKHWALPYVNLAASLTVKDGERETALVSGVGNGKFEPDSKITMAEAATILIRVLGYSSEQAGAVWPQSYMNLARSIGLTEGVNVAANSPITRAQAARIFTNALDCKTGGGEVYYKSLGSVSDGVIILAVNVETDDGSSHSAIRTSANQGSEAYLAAAGAVSPTGLQGKRGALVLNEKNEIVTFVPDESSAITVTLSGDAQPSYVKGTDGKRYTMGKDTVLYTADAREGTAYLDGYTALRSGTQVTLYTERGKIVAVYGGGSTVSTESGAVVVKGTPTEADFYRLTGGTSGYTIRKNRQTITMADLKPYDVVTYDSLNNTLLVSDLKLGCIYEDAAPNAKAPTTITMLGHTFEVLDSAWDDMEKAELGRQVTLLLTTDGKVAGIYGDGGSKLRSNAVGMVTGESAEVFLPDGGSFKLTGTVSDGDRLENRLVQLSSTSRGRITARELNGRRASDDFLIREMKLDGYTVSNGVRIYERIPGGSMIPVSLGQLDQKSVPAGEVEFYHLNSSDMVDYIVLTASTGDGYTYGRLTLTEEEVSDQFGSDTLRYVTVANGTGGLGATLTHQAFTDGSFGGVVAANNAEGQTKAISIVKLTALTKVSPADFFQKDGMEYVSVRGKAYQVASDVECYKAQTKSWFTQETGASRLAACKAFSGDLTVHIDPVGEKVRVIEAN